MAGGRAGGQTDTMNLIVTLRDFVKAPENVWRRILRDKAINDKNCFLLQKLHCVALIVVALVSGAFGVIE